MVSIAAFQAVDPGSIPGRRMVFVVVFVVMFKDRKVAGIEHTRLFGPSVLMM